MKFTCHCGHIVSDATDALPHKSHVIPDTAWLGLLDEFDERVVDSLAAGRIDVDSAYMYIRELLIGAALPLYRCNECGRLWLDDGSRRLRSFAPE